MDIKELKELREGLYYKIDSPHFEIEILRKPPALMLAYDSRDMSYNYEVPKDVLDAFERSCNEKLVRCNDGFVYFREESQVRMKDISDDILRIFNSTEMTLYLNTISNQFSTNSQISLKPSDWALCNLEGGKVSDKDYKYINTCYNIPHEEYYKMSITAAQKTGDTHMDISIYITYPEPMHFDGIDSLNYPVYLLLLTGRVKNSHQIE